MCSSHQDTITWTSTFCMSLTQSAFKNTLKKECGAIKSKVTIILYHDFSCLYKNKKFSLIALNFIHKTLSHINFEFTLHAHSFLSKEK